MSNVGVGVSDQGFSKEPKPIKLPKVNKPAKMRSYDDFDRIINNLAINNRQWPERIYASAIINKMLAHCDGRNYGNQPCAFSIADRVSTEGYAYDRLYLRGSGFAEFCKTVPGIKVTMADTFPGAHGGYCRAYWLVIEDKAKVKRYLKRSVEMVNIRLNRIYTLKSPKPLTDDGFKPGALWK